MIRARDTILLARTKLKARRVRLAILLVTMSLLFAGLIFIAEIVSGTVTSLQSFGHEGLGGRYIVAATPMTYQAFGNNDLITQVKPLQDELVAKKKALAKKLDVPYDPKADTSLYYTNQQTGPSPTDVSPQLNGSLLGTEALNAQNNKIPGITYDAFASRATAAGATHTYRSANPNFSSLNGQANASITVLANGQEDYSANSSKQGYAGPPSGLASIQSLGWNQMSDALLQPFLLDGQDTKIGGDGTIPIVAPYSAAEQLLGLSKLPATATTEDKLNRLVQTRKQVAGKEALLCYRNEASSALLQKAIGQQADIAANKGKKDYSAPHLLYNLPSEACGGVTIKSDKRTDDEKTADKNQATFDSTFGQSTDPQQGIVKLRIVGLTPDIDTGNGGSSFSAGAILNGIFSSSIGYGWFSPISAFPAGSLAAQAQGGAITDKAINQQTYYAEFSSLERAKDFIKQTDCYGNSPPTYTLSYNPNDATSKCVAKNRPFSITPYGNNAGAISSFQHSVWKVGRFVLLGVVIIAVVVMMGTFSKVIADSRRETAVFRSLGASRLAVSQIYLTYTVLVSIIVAAFALLVGSIGAIVVSQKLSPGLSVNAVLTYNASDVHKQFTLLGFNAWYILAIVGLVIVTAIASAIVPLVLNMRRNPIRDMRDE